MRDAIRLVVTERCNRSCEGCCNKSIDFTQVPTTDNPFTSERKVVLLTGGEPALATDKIRKIYHQYKAVDNYKVYVYTAAVEYASTLWSMAFLFDGLTVTLHDQSDVVHFERLQRYLVESPWIVEKSMRLNIFKGIQVDNISLFWDVKDGIEWQYDCPVPSNEILMKYGG